MGIQASGHGIQILTETLTAGMHVLKMLGTVQAMYEAKFWEEGDVGLMKAWVFDLQAVGYKFPEVRSQAMPPAVLPPNWNQPTPEHW